MYFVASKLFWLVFAPSNFLCLLALAGMLLLIFNRRTVGTIVSLFAVAGLLAAIVSPLGDRLALSLEATYPKWQDDGRKVDGVIVLGGAVDVLASAAWDTLVLGDAGSRVVAMADLARRYPDAKIVFTGGYGALFGREISEAEQVERNIPLLGLAQGRVIFEKASRNTYENAVFTRDLVKMDPAEHWLLVTSALHMPRAMGIFRKAGIPVEAYPVAWHTAPGFEDAALSISVVDRLRTLDLAVREWIGLAAARVFGQIDRPS